MKSSKGHLNGGTQPSSMLPTQEIALSELLEGRSRSILRNKISDVLLFFVITSVVLGSLLLGACAVTVRVRGEDLWHQILSLVSLGGHFWGAFYLGAFAISGAVVSLVQFEIHPRGFAKSSRWTPFTFFFCFCLFYWLCARAMTTIFMSAPSHGVAVEIVFRALIIPRIGLLLASLRIMILGAFVVADSR
jgi:predicted small secreted protein